LWVFAASAFLFTHANFNFWLRAFLAAALCGPRLGFLQVGFTAVRVLTAPALFLPRDGGKVGY
jgi:hypothetical protein